MTGTGVFPKPVIGLADIICLINRFSLLTSETILIRSSNLFVPYLHGLPTGGTVNDTVEQVVKRAGVSLHNWWSAVNQLLNLIPFFRGYDCFMTVFNDFPFLTRNNVIGVGANPFLVRPKNQMSTFIKGISQDMADSGTSPIVIIFLTLCVGLHMGDRDFFFHQLFGNSHASQPIQRIVINLTDNRCCFGVDDEMPFILRITHQTQRRCSSAEFALSGADRDTTQNLFGNIPAIHII